MATISIDLEDGITVIIDTHQGQSRCTIDAEGARDLASALGLAASIVERREKRPELRLVD